MRKSLPKATKIMIVRHAEKPATDFTPYGLTINGKRSKESLTARGWQRAGALANLLAPTNGHFQHPLLAQPQSIYTSKFIKRRGSRRPIETITPLAEKLAIKINADFPRFAVDKLVEDLFRCKGVVLICWQREYIPKIAAAIMGSEGSVPAAWPEARFDLVWIFDRSRTSARYRFHQVPQSLLMGDQVTLIK
jgi:hypothetical protein